MNHPYLDPNDAPWTPEYQENYGHRLIEDDSDLEHDLSSIVYHHHSTLHIMGSHHPS